MSLPASGTILVKKVNENDDWIEDYLDASDIPINTSGSPWSEAGVSSTILESAIAEIATTLNTKATSVATDANRLAISDGSKQFESSSLSYATSDVNSIITLPSDSELKFQSSGTYGNYYLETGNTGEVRLGRDNRYLRINPSFERLAPSVDGEWTLGGTTDRLSNVYSYNLNIATAATLPGNVSFSTTGVNFKNKPLSFIAGLQAGGHINLSVALYNGGTTKNGLTLGDPSPNSQNVTRSLYIGGSSSNRNIYITQGSSTDGNLVFQGPNAFYFQNQSSAGYGTPFGVTTLFQMDSSEVSSFIPLNMNNNDISSIAGLTATSGDITQLTGTSGSFTKVLTAEVALGTTSLTSTGLSNSAGNTLIESTTFSGTDLSTGKVEASEVILGDTALTSNGLSNSSGAILIENTTFSGSNITSTGDFNIGNAVVQGIAFANGLLPISPGISGTTIGGQLGDQRFAKLFTVGGTIEGYLDGALFYQFLADSGAVISLRANGPDGNALFLDGNGSFYPETDFEGILGSITNRWSSVYTEAIRTSEDLLLAYSGVGGELNINYGGDPIYTISGEGTTHYFRSLSATGTDAIVSINSGSQERWRFLVNGTFTPTASGLFDIGTSSVRVRDIYLTNSPDVASDARLKTDVFDLNPTDSLNALMNITPKGFKLKEVIDPTGYTNEHLGFMAQEIYEYIPQVVSPGDLATEYTGGPESKMWSIKHNELIPVLVSAIQKLKQEIEDLLARVAALETP